MDRRRLWQRWLVVVAAGELVGFAFPAAAGLWSRDMSSVAQLATMSGAGLFEGAMLGFAQAAVLRRSLPGFRAGAWVVATSLAAAVAWFLGMLPSTTHDTWSTWPVGWVVVVGGVLGTVLLATIGTAQAVVLPRGTRRPFAWVGWTALGWCAGLTAFTVVATPLWHEGQAAWAIVLVGLVGGAVMALAMAAVTGVGAVRLVHRAQGADPEAVFGPGQQLFSTLLGTAVYDATGHRVGRVNDLVVDLAVDLDRAPVSRLVIRARGGRRVEAHWSTVMVRPAGDGLVVAEPLVEFDDRGLETSEVLVRADVLDSPVITADPPRRTRVSDVALEVGSAGAWVTGIDLSPAGTLRRLLPVPMLAKPSAVPLSRVHLLSRRGHASQLSVPETMVRGLPAQPMAEVLTRVPVSHARDIIRIVDQTVRDDAVRLLHPHVRARVTGESAPPRRTRRLGGWRLHRPGTQDRSGSGR